MTSLPEPETVSVPFVVTSDATDSQVSVPPATTTSPPQPQPCLNANLPSVTVNVPLDVETCVFVPSATSATNQLSMLRPFPVGAKFTLTLPVKNGCAPSVCWFCVVGTMFSVAGVSLWKG